MLQYNTHDLRVFEVAIYNRDVRAAVKENRSHSLYGDHWADVQLHDVTAHNESEAREMIADRFPPAEGFVVEEMIPSGL